MRRVFIRGCPGQGTGWFANVVTCLYAAASVSSDEKHNGCHINSPSDPYLVQKLAHPSCHPHDCLHAVIARHPLELKHGRPGAYRVWEAYYGAWARSNISNARFFRYEDLVRMGCTAARANSTFVRHYFRRPHACVAVGDSLAWRVWNYSNIGCVGTQAASPRKSPPAGSRRDATVQPGRSVRRRKSKRVPK